MSASLICPLLISQSKNIPAKIEEEKPIEWLEKGAEAQSDRLLGNWCDR
ncbi:MAG TPA: hypothetical protein V6D30_09645 [Leptolyngbyaceae cyanobacterium]